MPTFHVPAGNSIFSFLGEVRPLCILGQNIAANKARNRSSFHFARCKKSLAQNFCTRQKYIVHVLSNTRRFQPIPLTPRSESGTPHRRRSSLVPFPYHPPFRGRTIIVGIIFHAFSVRTRNLLRGCPTLCMHLRYSTA